MPAIGGSIESVDVGGREISVDAESPVTMHLGGFNNESKANGNGTARLLKTRVIPRIEGIKANADNSENDLEYLQDTADTNVYHDCTITFVDGSIYTGRFQVTEVTYGSGDALNSFDLQGERKITKQ